MQIAIFRWTCKKGRFQNGCRFAIQIVQGTHCNHDPNPPPVWPQQAQHSAIGLMNSPWVGECWPHYPRPENPTRKRRVPIVRDSPFAAIIYTTEKGFANILQQITKNGFEMDVNVEMYSVPVCLASSCDREDDLSDVVDQVIGEVLLNVNLEDLEGELPDGLELEHEENANASHAAISASALRHNYTHADRFEKLARE